jgi:diacylglycerol kinase family enzyme
VADWLALAVRVLLRRPRKDPQLEVVQARRVEVACDRPQPVERDGDPVGDRDHLVVEVVPQALTLCVPPQEAGARAGPPVQQVKGSAP